MSKYPPKDSFEGSPDLLVEEMTRQLASPDADDMYRKIPLKGSEYTPNDGLLEGKFRNEMLVGALGSIAEDGTTQGDGRKVIHSFAVNNPLIVTYGISGAQVNRFKDGIYGRFIPSGSMAKSQQEIFDLMNEARVYSSHEKYSLGARFLGGILTYARPHDQKMRADLVVFRSLYKTQRLLDRFFKPKRESDDEFTEDIFSTMALKGAKYQQKLALFALLGTFPEDIDPISVDFRANDQN